MFTGRQADHLTIMSDPENSSVAVASAAAPAEKTNAASDSNHDDPATKTGQFKHRQTSDRTTILYRLASGLQNLSISKATLNPMHKKTYTRLVVLDLGIETKKES